MHDILGKLGERELVVEADVRPSEECSNLVPGGLEIEVSEEVHQCRYTYVVELSPIEVLEASQCTKLSRLLQFKLRPLHLHMITQLQMKQVRSLSQQWQNHLDSNITAPPVARRLLPLMIATSYHRLSQGLARLRQYYHQKVINIKETVLIIVEDLEQHIKIILV